MGSEGGVRPDRDLGSGYTCVARRFGIRIVADDLAVFLWLTGATVYVFVWQLITSYEKEYADQGACPCTVLVRNANNVAYEAPEQVEA
jgi:hypothetical protein